MPGKLRHKQKSLLILSSRLLKSFCMLPIILLILLGCSTAKSGAEVGYSEAWLQTQSMVRQFGQVSSTYHTNYLKNLSERLADTFKRHGYPQIAPRIILLNTRQPLALWPGSNFVLLSRGLIMALGTESELAFIIAHELSHQALGHSPIVDESINIPLTSSVSSQELDADRMALGITALAGYDPRSAISALKNTYRFASTYTELDDDYPKLETRVNAAIDAIRESGWNGLAIGDRREFHTFRNSLK